MTHTDLRPCPFCGSDQVTMSKGWASDSIAWVAICKACSASVDHEDEASAAKAWNTRAPDTAPSQSGDQTAWLVEMPSPVDGSPQWFCAGRGGWNWIKDAHTAIWFVRKRDAEQFADWACLSGWPNARVTEHMWVKVEAARRALGGSND